MRGALYGALRRNAYKAVKEATRDVSRKQAALKDAENTLTNLRISAANTMILIPSKVELSDDQKYFVQRPVESRYK